MRDDGSILIRDCSDKTGDHTYLVRAHFEVGAPGPQYKDNIRGFYKKIGELFITFSQFQTLFSDYSSGDPELFTLMFLDPRCAWYEVERLEDNEEVGIMYLTDITPHWDAMAHLSFWDKTFAGREPLIHDMIEWTMKRFELHRLIAEIPVPQRVYNFFVEERLGFVKEGVSREATIKNGEWIDMNRYSLLESDLAKGREKWAERQLATA